MHFRSTHPSPLIAAIGYMVFVIATFIQFFLIMISVVAFAAAIRDGRIGAIRNISSWLPFIFGVTAMGIAWAGWTLHRSPDRKSAVTYFLLQSSLFGTTFFCALLSFLSVYLAFAGILGFLFLGIFDRYRRQLEMSTRNVGNEVLPDRIGSTSKTGRFIQDHE